MPPNVSDSEVDNVNIEEPLQFFAAEKAVVEATAPPSLHHSTASVAQEVTIHQVAPLVLVLTGATFLHVRSLTLNWS